MDKVYEIKDMIKDYQIRVESVEVKLKLLW